MKNDILGKALRSFYHTGEEVEINVSSNLSDWEVTPASYFFRRYSEMNRLEQLAMDLCHGHVLDVGAGAGAHAIHLQEDRQEVTALEQSEILSSLMTERGIKNVICNELMSWEPKTTGFDTIILLMNGCGIAQTLNRFAEFLNKLLSLLNESGQILLDSSDISSLYQDEDGVMHLDLSTHYFGEITYHIEYDGEKQSFPWIFIEFETLEELCTELGLSCVRLMDYESSFLVKITRQ